ncbi:phosphotransferase [Candidatus Woesearchaeota archaeon]|nr:phosphotransferase [Candidatus Woesearchaeota archaeon]
MYALTKDKIRINGHSNFSLFLQKKKNGYFVEKSSKPKDADRLKRQCHKQEMYSGLMQEDPTISVFFEIPEIISRNEDESFSFLMKYYNGNSILNVIELGDIYYMDILVDYISRFIRWEIKNSKAGLFEVDKLQHKLKSIRKTINTSLENTNKLKFTNHEAYSKEMIKIIDRLIEISSKFAGQNIPLGHCHGDLTFSNMIFTNKIVLIDFLDSYIETPLQDVAKIMQEINLRWSLLMNHNGTDIAKVKIGYGYLKKKLDASLQSIMTEFKIDSRISSIFYMTTLLRIVPYIKDEKIYEAVAKEIINS